MTNLGALQQLRISVASRLKRTYVEIALLRKNKTPDNNLLIDLKAKRSNLDRLINKIDKAISCADYDQYTTLYNTFKDY